jgi:alpha-amylase
VVTVIYAVGGNSWSNSQSISASFSSSGTNGYETWVFSGNAPGATQFYIKYDVSGTSYVLTYLKNFCITLTHVEVL